MKIAVYGTIVGLSTWGALIAGSQTRTTWFIVMGSIALIQLVMELNREKEARH